jgi:hypothetical protein
MTSPMFFDWSLHGVDDAGEPVHEPTLRNDIIVCRCREEDCQLDRALFRARIVGFVQAYETLRDGKHRGELDAVFGEGLKFHLATLATLPMVDEIAAQLPWLRS